MVTKEVKKMTATLKKQCDECGLWEKQTMGKCAKTNNVTMANHTCREYNLPKLERIFAKYKTLKMEMKNGKVIIYMAHWSGKGITIKEAMHNLELKI